MEEKLAEEEQKEKELESSSSNNFFGYGGLGGMMIMSEPEPEEKETPEEGATSKNSFQEILHSYFIQEALISHLTRVRTYILKCITD